MKVVTVHFQGYYGMDVEVPNDWTQTPENINKLRTKAFEVADFTDGGASWDAYSYELAGESFEMDY